MVISRNIELYSTVFILFYMQGLKYIHSLGLVHMDIKPGKLTLTNPAFLILKMAVHNSSHVFNFVGNCDSFKMAEGSQNEEF